MEHAILGSALGVLEYSQKQLTELHPANSAMQKAILGAILGATFGIGGMPHKGVSLQPKLSKQFCGGPHFNPMWTFPTTSVNQNWEPMTFGMAPWHIIEATGHFKDALVSQSPIVVFKSRNMLQALGIAYSRIVLPNTGSKGETKGKTYCPATWNYAYQWQYAAEYADLLRQAGASSLLRQECTLSVITQLIEQQECQSSKFCICRFSQYSHEWRDGQSHSMYQGFYGSSDCAT